MNNSDNSKLDTSELDGPFIPVAYLQTALNILMKIFSESYMNIKMNDSPEEALSVIIGLAYIVLEHDVEELFKPDGNFSDLILDYCIFKAPILLVLHKGYDNYWDDNGNIRSKWL